MNKRINIVLPKSTIRAIARMAPRGQRSQFIDRAVQHYVADQSNEALRERLERTALRDQDLDRQVAADWHAVDEEAWRRARRTIRSGAKSTSRRLTRR